MRACYPDETGYVERDGVKTYWEVYGDGDPTIMLMPTWSLVHSRMWKGQIAYLARHYRVVTFDGRGNGRSDRPKGVASYVDAEFVADTKAVMDATETESAVFVAKSCGAPWTIMIAADDPERVIGAVCIGPSVPLAPPHPERAIMSRFEEELDTDEGWAKYNRAYWQRDYRGFLEFFFAKLYSDPHSTKQIEDSIRWALETDPETLADTSAALGLCGLEEFSQVCERVRCPVLVMHGTEDLIRPFAQGEALARVTGGRLVPFEGCGHAPMGRYPVKVNLLIREFVDSIRAKAEATPEWVPA